jgi:hypothetical protein
METQNVQPDRTGHYTVQLGAVSKDGLPADVFMTGEARWLAVQIGNEAEQPRVTLVAVPYAMKAADAEMLGGKPASAYLTSEVLPSAGNSSAAAAIAPASTSHAEAKPSTMTTPKNNVAAPVTPCSITSDGTASTGSIAKFTAPCNIQSSGITETAGKVGIGISTPGAMLDVNASNTINSPVAQFGSFVTDSSNSILVHNVFCPFNLCLPQTLAKGSSEVFLSGQPNTYVPGTRPGDGGFRVVPGRNIVFGDSTTSRMVIASNGEVGIGTAIPASNLDVAGLQHTLLGNTGCGGAFGGIGFGPSSLTDCTHYSILGEGVHTYLNRPTGGQILFREGNVTEMVLASGGNLGIGTTTPTFPLHVNGIIRAETGLSLGGNSALSVDAPGVIGGQFLVRNGTVSIGGDTPMSSAPHLSFSGSFPGAFCNDMTCGCNHTVTINCFNGSIAVGGYFVADKAITITRVSVSLGNVIDKSCGNLAGIKLVYGVPTFLDFQYIVVPQPNVHFFDSGPLSLAIPAGNAVLLTLTQPTTSCTVGSSGGGYAFVNVGYVMQ